MDDFKDIYQSRLAIFLAKWNKSITWAITTSAKCTRYSCTITQVDGAWRAHEDMHKKQFSAIRFFVIKYLIESIRHGYANNKYELAAEAAALAYLASQQPTNQNI